METIVKKVSDCRDKRAGNAVVNMERVRIISVCVIKDFMESVVMRGRSDEDIRC